MTLPDIRDDEGSPPHQRPTVFAAVLGGGVCLLAAIAGLTVIGMQYENSGEVVATGLTSVAATLAGGFAGWIARGRGSNSN